MSDLAEFLLQRIAEDEANAEARISGELDSLHKDGLPDLTRDDLLTPKPNFDHAFWARPLAECEAKRRIVQRCLDLIASFGDWDAAVAVAAGGRALWDDVTRRERAHARSTLDALAAVYADHPDYGDEWRV